MNFLCDLPFPSARETAALSLLSRHSQMPPRSFSWLTRVRVTSTRADGRAFFFPFPSSFPRSKLGCAPFPRFLSCQNGKIAHALMEITICQVVIVGAIIDQHFVATVLSPPLFLLFLSLRSPLKRTGVSLFNQTASDDESLSFMYEQK